MKRKRDEEKVVSEIRSAIEELSTLAKLKPKNGHNPGAAQIPTVPFLSICDLVIQVLGWFAYYNYNHISSTYIILYYIVV